MQAFHAERARFLATEAAANNGQITRTSRSGPAPRTERAAPRRAAAPPKKSPFVLAKKFTSAAAWGSKPAVRDGDGASAPLAREPTTSAVRGGRNPRVAASPLPVTPNMSARSSAPPPLRGS